MTPGVPDDPCDRLESMLDELNSLIWSGRNEELVCKVQRAARASEAEWSAAAEELEVFVIERGVLAQFRRMLADKYAEADRELARATQWSEE